MKITDKDRIEFLEKEMLSLSATYTIPFKGNFKKMDFIWNMEMKNQ